MISFLFFLQGYSPLGSPGTSWLKGNVLQHPVVLLVADKLGKTPAQIALRWGLQMGHSVLPKSTHEARIKENLDVFGWSIPDELFAKFSEIDQARYFVICSYSLYSFDSLIRDLIFCFLLLNDYWLQGKTLLCVLLKQPFDQVVINLIL